VYVVVRFCDGEDADVFGDAQKELVAAM